MSDVIERANNVIEILSIIVRKELLQEYTLSLTEMYNLMDGFSALEIRAQSAEAKLNTALDLLEFYRNKHPDYPRANEQVDILLDGRKKEDGE